MELINDQLNTYCETHTTPETPLLQELNRDTYLKVLSPNMLSGHLQGAFLSMISNMIRPRYVLEIGTYTGYSALCLAQGLRPGGMLFSLDVDEETTAMAQSYIDRSDAKDRITLVVQDAKQYIPSLTQQFDLVFIDADKASYALYYDLVFDKVSPGGFILIDNVLWKGKITAPEQSMDAKTLAIHRFNQKVQNDPRTENMLLPLRDGMMLVRKK